MADGSRALSVRADRARNHLSDLVESLQHQVTPSELFDQLTSGRLGIEEAGLVRAITAQVKNNPIACILIAAGIGWLMVSERTERSRPSRRPRPRNEARKRRPRQKNKAA